MYILGKVPVINEITNEKEGEQLSLICLDIMSIKQILACPKTGNGIIEYKIPSPLLETCIPFNDLFSSFHDQGLLNLAYINKVKDVSSTFTNYIKESHGL